MAISTRQTLLKRIRKSANCLKVASKWATTGKPLQIAEDFLYEMYILFSIIGDLKLSYSIKFIEGIGNKKACFPRKPAKKAGWPRFHLLEKGGSSVKFQICGGTGILDIHSKARHPDISFQTSTAPDVPKYEHCIMIWDAKYRAKSSSRISHPELSEFGRCIELLNLRDKKVFRINFSAYYRLAGNCLITNGEFSTEPEEECSRLNMKEVSRFFPSCTIKFKP